MTAHDIVIVGSGPAGYTAAVYAARADLRPIVIEGSVTAGGALMNTTDVENFPGFAEGIMGPDLMGRLRAQAERFGAVLVADDAVEIEVGDGGGRISLADGTRYDASALVLAMGAAHRKLSLPGEERLAGHGVSWCATCDGFFFRDQHIVVVGGGDSALEEATFLTRFARKVTLVHRKDTLRASRIMQDRAFANPKIEFAYDSVIDSFQGDSRVQGVTLRNVHDGSLRRLDATGVFIAIGHDPRSNLVRGQVALDDAGYVITQPGTTMTSRAGVFAAGDLVDRVYRQAITAAGTGAAAALDAERYLARSRTSVNV